MDQLWWELYNRECAEGLTDVKSEAQKLRRFSAQEHDTYMTIPFRALLLNLSFTKHISV